jgi:type I restriction-modification system DNA methylase subunit
MGLFQTSVINKHLKNFNKSVVNAAFQKFISHFKNPAIQDNIRNSKEEQYQGEFLIDLFVNVLGYTKNPTPNFNLTTEHKNVKDSKKADGAIIVNGAVRAVIELKGTNTTDLGKVEDQAFSYKNNQPGCTYVITSNFEKLRFYIDNAVEYIEFNLFSLTEKEFELLYLCLSYKSILADTPKVAKDESLSREDTITKQFYNDYSLFKRELYNNLVTLNTTFSPLDLFTKSQKLLDRFLFLFFAEDRLLLPPNSVRLILSDWQDLQDRDVEIPLYSRFKNYFEYLNTGYKGKRYDVFAYNGGLFKPDPILDNVHIDDDLLYKHTSIIADYNFESEVDVNILGHIFENSLNELDEVKTLIQGGKIDKSTTKRKKEGVFYTPKYITKYIVANTVGKLCEEKKADLQIVETEYYTDKKRQKKTTKHLVDKLEHYRDWLLQLTICDPACGSGAFLNQALDFLITEHRNVDELQAKVLGYSIVFSDIEKSILENNIFGVDLNEESVEIAKLSLWLRTAQPNRKLNDLNNNVKCGNSLINDDKVVGEKAFDWETAFPQVFAKGGFDVVIGNPPYVFGGNEGISPQAKVYFKNHYETGNGKVNLFTLFIEKSHMILKRGGEFSFIIPNTFLRVTSYHDSRKFFINKFNFRELADLGTDIFENAVTTAMILIASKAIPKTDSTVRIIKDFSGKYTELELKEIIENDYIITTNVSVPKGLILKKMTLDSITLGDECKEMIFGVVITKNKDEVVFDTQVNGYKPFLEGKDISSYFIKPVHQYLNYRPELLHRARTKEVFEVPEKLLVQRITGGKKPLKVAYDNFGYYNKESINNIILKPDSRFKSKFILTLLNSNLINWYYNNQFTNESTLTVNISKEYLSKIPIKYSEQQPLINKADLMIALNKSLQEESHKFQRVIQRNFSLDELSKKLQEWYKLTYSEFLKELHKVKVRIPLEQESEWEDYFVKHAKEVLEIVDRIDMTEKEIDRLVYELYQLSEEEIQIVESS